MRFIFIFLAVTSVFGQVDSTQVGGEQLGEIVVSGTLKSVRRLESPVPVEVLSPKFLKKNPTSNIFEALQCVNGVRPQVNCNVCNTGDIHINGLEGPYTMVLIDGMPIVSGLSTVYGLSGIPNSLVDRIEIVKGPASSIYGSEAVGGLINIITKDPQIAPRFSADFFTTGWGEHSSDLGFKTTVGKSSALLGLNYFNYSNPKDLNHDNFTDVTLQDRLSVFNKWQIHRKSGKAFSLAGRYFYEDRWGGEMNWSKRHRGGNEVYGESIYTRRYELLGNYQMPLNETVFLQFSMTDHDQNSVYGDQPFSARQRILFVQALWEGKAGSHEFVVGSALKNTFYNDDTPATTTAERNLIPGIFIQDNISVSAQHNLLLGARYDFNENHGAIFTPRIAWKYKLNDHNLLRLNAGTGFRVVSLFTEEHAALTGARDVVVSQDLKPERSYNINLNYIKSFRLKGGHHIGLEAAAWYTYFTNSILPDYDTNPQLIIYKNLDGFAVTQGVSLNADISIRRGPKMTLGFTWMDVSKTENGIRTDQILTESFSGTWAVSQRFDRIGLEIDYTGNLYGPMRLPLLGDLDPRREYSPVWSVQNIQFTYTSIKDCEIYLGIKNLLNWTPVKGNPFIIARSHDPFDENVVYDNAGQVVPTVENPYALTFDPSYVYGPNQGIRGFIGMRYTFY